MYSGLWSWHIHGGALSFIQVKQKQVNIFMLLFTTQVAHYSFSWGRGWYKGSEKVRYHPLPWTPEASPELLVEEKRSEGNHPRPHDCPVADPVRLILELSHQWHQAVVFTRQVCLNGVLPPLGIINEELRRRGERMLTVESFNSWSNSDQGIRNSGT